MANFVNITSAPLTGDGNGQAEYYYNDDEEHRDFSCQRECGERLWSINTSSAQETVLDSRSKARVFMTSGYDLVPASESTSSPLVCSLFVFDCMGASVRVAMYNEDDRQFHALKAISGHGNTLCHAGKNTGRRREPYHRATILRPSSCVICMPTRDTY